MKKLLNILFGRTLAIKTETQLKEEYLSQSVDNYDLEYRMRKLDRKSFNGQNFRSLYKGLYTWLNFIKFKTSKHQCLIH